MHPVLFSLGGIAVHGYGVAGAVGFVILCFIALRRGSDLGIQRERIADLIFWTSVFALVGARGLFIWQNPGQFSTAWDLINLRRGGLVFYGAMFSGLPAGALLCLYYRLPLFKLVDVFSTALPLAHGISRLGCLFAGCCWGRPTDLPWGVTYSDPIAPGPHGIPVHPTQLYEALYLFAVTAFCAWLYPRKRFDGQVAVAYLGLYAIFRPINEVFRDDPERGWFLEPLIGQVMTLSQGLSIIVALTTIALSIAMVARPRPPAPAVS
jgi:phosphatidylglycerol:prolipoprotein diacylglycerol transferase